MSSGFTITVTPNEGDDTPAPAAGFAVGNSVQRQSDPAVLAAAQAGNEIVPADPSKACVVNLWASGGQGGTKVQLGSWSQETNDFRTLDQGDEAGFSLIVAAGESYFVDITGGGTVHKIIERPLG